MMNGCVFRPSRLVSAIAMDDYVLGIDAGGTKTLATLKCMRTQQHWSEKSGPGSLSNDFSAAIDNIQQVISALLTTAGCQAAQTSVVCGAAGANNPDLRTRLETQLKSRFRNLLVTTDARTSLYGAGMGEATIVIALGTGSVAMRLDESGAEREFGGWGFIAGDLGSGADIGRALVTAVLLQFDRSIAQRSELLDQAMAVIGDSRPRILTWLQNATPATYAALVPLACAHQNSDPMAKEILHKAARSVAQLIEISRGQLQLPVRLVGGLRETIFPLLDRELQACIVAAKGDAVDGAIFLAEQLLADSK